MDIQEIKTEYEAGHLECVYICPDKQLHLVYNVYIHLEAVCIAEPFTDDKGLIRRFKTVPDTKRALSSLGLNYSYFLID